MRLLTVSCCLGLVAALPSQYDPYSEVSKPIAVVNENMAAMMGNAPVLNTMQAVEQSMTETQRDDLQPRQTTEDGGSEGDVDLEKFILLLGLSPLNEESHDGELLHSSKTESTSWSQTFESSSSVNVTNADGSISEAILKQDAGYGINGPQDNSLAQTFTGSTADTSASTAVVEEAVINVESSDDINSEEPANQANLSGGTSSSAASTSSTASSAAAAGKAATSAAGGGDAASSAASGGGAASSAASGGGAASSAAAGGDGASSSAARGDAASSAASGGGAASSAAAGGDGASSAAAGGDGASSAATGGGAVSSVAAGGGAVSSAAAGGDAASSAVSGSGAASSAAAGGDGVSSAAASGDDVSSAAAVGAGASSSVAAVADGDNASPPSSESALPSAAHSYGAEDIDGDYASEDYELLEELFEGSAPPPVCVPFYLCSGGHVITDGAGVIDIRFGGNVSESQSHSLCPNPLDVYCRWPRSKPDPELVEELIDYDYVPSCGRRNPGGIGFQLEGFKDGETQFGEFPWMSIVLEDEEVAYGQTIQRYVCGASLIHPQAILTAAHCVHGKDASKLSIRLGEWDSFSEKEMMPYEEHRVAHMENHERFNSGNLRYDVAVLFLEEPVKLKQHIDTICLPEENENFDYSSCVSTGFGKDRFEGGSFQNIMKQVDLPVVPRTDCQNRLRETRLGRWFRLHRTFTCAGGIDGVDTCRGDGGGPLVCPSKEDPTRYVQAGIVAWGIGCGEGGVPGVYASVPKLVKWVNTKMTEYFRYTVQKETRGKSAPPV